MDVRMDVRVDGRVEGRRPPPPPAGFHQTDPETKVWDTWAHLGFSCRPGIFRGHAAF